VKSEVFFKNTRKKERERENLKSHNNSNNARERDK
jgi:hypothetical protein